MNQDQRRRIFIPGFLVVNARAIDVREPGTLGVVDEVETVAPVDVARAREQPGRYGAGDQPGGSGKEISLLHNG